MGAYENFERDFIERTLQLIEQYDHHVMPNVPDNEQYEVTLLLNCLLGLLVLPRQSLFAQVPAIPVNQLQAWGLPTDVVKDWGQHSGKIVPADYETLRELVHEMRNGIAHLRVKIHDDDQRIADIEFSDTNGFNAIIPITSLRIFVKKLAETVKPKA